MKQLVLREDKYAYRTSVMRAVMGPMWQLDDNIKVDLNEV
jgi:hypothetical protein